MYKASNCCLEDQRREVQTFTQTIRGKCLPNVLYHRNRQHLATFSMTSILTQCKAITPVLQDGMTFMTVYEVSQVSGTFLTVDTCT